MIKVAVIGAGVSGLTSAVEIQKRFGNAAQITVFSEKLSPETTGDVSAGLWGPYLLQDTPMCDIIKWSKVTQDYFLALWKDGKANPAGVSLVPIMMLSEDPNYKIPEWAHITLGAENLSPEYLKKLGEEHNGKYTGGFQFVSFTCEPAKFLPYLQEEFQRRGGRLVLKKIENFEELSGFDVVINCCGLYAQHLVPDEKMQAIRGQVARVKAPWQFHVLFDDHNYVIANMDCTVLGGTHQEGDTDLNPRKDDCEYILNGCNRLVPSLKKAELIKHMVGLRPGRTRVRIEIEKREIGGKATTVIHNYGHGGSGVTMCRGCALDVCDLFQKALNVKPSKL